MNKVILMGRLTRDPEIRYANNANSTCIANYTLAVDRRFKRQGDEQTADFIQCVAMGKGGEFAEKYLHQGTKIVVEGRIQTGSYTNKDGQKIFTTEVWVESQEFAESKAASAQNGNQNASAPTRPNVAQNDSDGFMNIPDAIEEELPFATN
ncbi:single-stranded DNA-binding protein [Clostridium sp. AM49-4BH]|uniref:single-stranded DNA-binding protein n=1 Tax=Clostridium sp. AM49-4BH TaxID=2293035 RepID=UPI000E4C0F33|nr:single-stranded DNA-binding protein [Clostridium sp. AM49-4BH]RHQ12359.1 single-stranded DNA-binding protein [Clostridium sp. AM49-4BH]